MDPDNISFPRSAWECCRGRSASLLLTTAHTHLDAERPKLHSHAERGNDQRSINWIPAFAGMTG